MREDVAFAFDVTETAMREYVEATWGPWIVEQQRELHANSFDLQTHSVVVLDGVPSGILAVQEVHDHVQLEKLYLLPAARNRGLGSVLLNRVIERSRALKKPVHLRVLAVNTSAQRFYGRHGFVVVQTTKERVFMECALSNPSFERIGFAAAELNR